MSKYLIVAGIVAALAYPAPAHADEPVVGSPANSRAMRSR